MVVEPWFSKLFWIALGGGAGSALRYALAGWVQQDRAGFPLGTLTVNIVGCLMMGFLATRFEMSSADPRIRLGVLVGVLGGFTTFSTFSWETLKLIQDHDVLRATLNAGGSLVSCMAAVWLGQALARRMSIP
ncbi:MAG: fluoride efflux transporter CrcB [Phycisphaerales bacterium]|nr:fluoride efflux transporter CrcB [Phycisphaerales bacterium]